MHGKANNHWNRASVVSLIYTPRPLGRGAGSISAMGVKFVRWGQQKGLGWGLCTTQWVEGVKKAQYLPGELGSKREGSTSKS